MMIHLAHVIVLFLLYFGVVAGPVGEIDRPLPINSNLPSLRQPVPAGLLPEGLLIAGSRLFPVPFQKAADAPLPESRSNRPSRVWDWLNFLVIGIILFAAVAYGYFLQKRQAAKLEAEVALRTRQLMASEQRYRELFEETRDVVFISSPEGCFLDINTAGVEVFGYATKSDMKALDIARDLFVSEADRIAYQEKLAWQGYLHNYEIHLKHRNGTILTLLETVTAVRNDDGEILQYRGIMRDVTRQKLLEKQLHLAERMESLGQLAGGIAHDFNNLLSSILGYANLMRLSLKPEEPFYSYVKTIEESSRRAAEMTEQLLGFAQKQSYNIDAVNLNKLIPETLKLLSRNIDHSICIETRLEEDLPPVEVNEAQMQRVIINLGVNARDAMPGGGTLSIATRSVLLQSADVEAYGVKPGNYVCMTMQDSGNGIPEELQRQIFEPFFTTKGSGKGTGLGLALAYGVMKTHHGFIRVESELNKGTCFHVYLPVSGRSAKRQVSMQSTPVVGGETILVVDDEPHILSLMQHSLEKYGYQVLLAANGLEALEQLENNARDIQLVVLDMIMPKMDGRQTFKEIKKRRPELRVVVSTGYVEKEAGEEYLLSNMDVEYIVRKPFKITEMLQVIRNVLDTPR